jgi:hypothetical protein
MGEVKGSAFSRRRTTADELYATYGDLWEVRQSPRSNLFTFHLSLSHCVPLIDGVSLSLYRCPR